MRFSARLSTVVKMLRICIREKFSEADINAVIAGNHDGFGRDTHLFRQIRYEAGNSENADETRSLTILADKFIEESPDRHKIKGFIHSIGVRPLHVFCWSEEGIRIYHDLCKKDVIFLDATGSVVRSHNHKRVLYYEISCRHPIEGQPTIPVSSMISSSHAEKDVRHWFHSFRFAEQSIYGHNGSSYPGLVLIDRSAVFLKVLLKEYNAETVSEFLDRCFDVVSGDATIEHFQKKQFLMHAQAMS